MLLCSVYGEEPLSLCCEMRPPHKFTYLVTACAASVLVMLLAAVQLLSSSSKVGVSLLNRLPVLHYGIDCVQRPNKTCNPSDLIFKVHERNQQRKAHVENVCAKYDISTSYQYIQQKKTESIYVDDKNKILYCAIPKVACTNWKRVLLVLSGKTNYTNPLDIPSPYAHSSDMEQLVPTLDTFTPEEIQYRLKHYFKFVIVRNPLERFLSAYRNKFTKPYSTYFHERFGRHIVRKYRTNPSKKSLRLGNDVTFEEFIRYILDPTTRRPFNEHWRPMHKLCFPCLHKYDVIGKYETMADDVTYILQAAGVSDLVTFPQAYHVTSTSTPKTSDLVKEAYQNVSSEVIHKLWELYSVDYALFDYPYPDDLGY